MGRHLRTDVPQVKKSLIPNWLHKSNFRELDKKYKTAQNQNYDQRCRVKQLPALPDGLPVWIDDQGSQVPGEVVQQCNTPRYYQNETVTGECNRCHL